MKKIILYAAMMILLINIVSALNITVVGGGNDGVIRKINTDIVLTTTSSKLRWYNAVGAYAEAPGTYFNLWYGTKWWYNDIDLYYICQRAAGNRNICFTRHWLGDQLTYSISDADWETNLDVFQAYPDTSGFETVFMTYTNANNTASFWKVMNRSGASMVNITAQWNLPPVAGCNPNPKSPTTPLRLCYPPFLSYENSSVWINSIFIDGHQTSLQQLKYIKYKVDMTNKNLTAYTVLTRTDPPWNTTNFFIPSGRQLFVMEDEDNSSFTIYGGDGENLYCLMNDDGTTFCYEDQTTFTRDGDSINASTYYTSGIINTPLFSRPWEVFRNYSNDNALFYHDTYLNNESHFAPQYWWPGKISYHGYSMFAMNATDLLLIDDLGGAATCGNTFCESGENANNCPVDCAASCGDGYCTHNETAGSCPVDCATAPSENYTFWNFSEITITTPNTSNDWRSLKYVDNTTILIAGESLGSDKVFKIDTTNKSNLLAVSSGLLADFAYRVDYVSDTVMVATDDEIHSFSGYSVDSLSLIDTDNWPGFHPDIANSYFQLTNETGFVCDNFDEPDYHEIGSSPTGNVGGTCNDLYFHNDILYVDSGDDGLSIWNATDQENLVLLTTYDHRNLSATRDWGDLIDYHEGLLLMKRNTRSMTLFDVTNPLSPSIVVECNAGGGGEIVSVEIIDNQTIFGGTKDGRVAVCNVSNTDETNNTNLYSLQNFPSEDVHALALGSDGYLYTLGNTTFKIYSFQTTNATSNTPPNLTSITATQTSIATNQPTIITIVAGNVEPDDVIWYGIKCEGTETSYTANTNGEFTCTYNTSGTYNAVGAVSDNFHLPNWYYPTSIEINVSPENFTGGLLKIIVLDEDQQAISNASVTVENTTTATSEYGVALFTTNDTGLYEVTTLKTGYYTDVSNFYADGTNHYVTLIEEPSVGDTVLQVTVVDEQANPVEDVLVSYTNTQNYEYAWKWTNALGLAIFTDISGGTVIVQASKDEYEAEDEAIVVEWNSTTTLTVTLEEFLATPTITSRNCTDDGIWLCGDVQTPCTIDADCLSDECLPTNTCSRFNYSVCDANGYPRSQKCVTKFTSESVLTSVTSWILGNLVWVLIILIVVIAMGFIFVAWQPKR